MKQLHHAKITVFCKGDENESLLIEKIKLLVPFDFEKEKINIKRISEEGFRDKKIMILEVVLEKERHLNEFLKVLLNNLTKEQKNVIANQAESRLDDELNFFIRLDKDDLLKNTFLLTDSGNCFHIKMSIAAFPAKREVALGIVREIFK